MPAEHSFSAQAQNAFLKRIKQKAIAHQAIGRVGGFCFNMTHRYEKSKYMYCTRLDGSDDHLCYSFTTHRFMILDPFQKLVFDQAPFEELSSGLLKSLHEAGFLVEGDEYESIRLQKKQTVENDRAVHLVICPTMACNFSCAYCIETGQLRSGSMTLEVMDGIIGFADKLIAASNAEKMEVVWFGGEPMLEAGIIRTLSERLIALCEASGVEYSAVIYTNGYFLNEENVRLLEASRVVAVRISVDGSRESHDRMRFLSGGQGSYERIIENLGIPTAMHYRIRCNMTRDNLNEYPVLVETLKRVREKSGNTIIVKPERMRVEKDVSRELKEKELSYPEYYAYFQSVKDLSVSEDVRDHFAYLLGKPTGVVCNATRRFSFCIDELGNLYKCNWFIGKAEHVIGNVFDFEDCSSIMGHADSERFLNTYACEREKCRNCVMLPACLGRCPLSWEIEGKYDCNRAVENLDRSLNESYRKYLELKRENG